MRERFPRISGGFKVSRFYDARDLLTRRDDLPRSTPGSSVARRVTVVYYSFIVVYILGGNSGGV